ncbi:hypothetical protein NDU88_004656 [Pleurodeles waltl]|uniref:Uncharacterized protein n=1 Tax=Pleurodeles waltl TaxID=8319 RepID=A0AAV7M6W7_PLEWA|nr:hypothetical protein NDU88_004656 [Pleurodeles waltl]
MAGYKDQAGDEYYMDDTAGSFEQDLVYTLDAAVRHTVNQALAQAMSLIKHHLLGFAEQQGWVAPSGGQAMSEHSLSGGSQSIMQSTNPHAAVFESLIRGMAKKHDYIASSSQKTKSREDMASSSPDHSSDQGDDPPRKHKKKSHHTFEPEDSVHRRSSLWMPPPEVTDYVESHIIHGFDKDVRSRLRSECPRPDFATKVTETPELDPTLVAFWKNSSKDPKKGKERACRGCQDKLLDVSGPLTKILEVGFQAKESDEAINPDVLGGWAPGALCFLGNANCAISSEHRRSILIKLDPKLADLAPTEGLGTYFLDYRSLKNFQSSW